VTDFEGQHLAETISSLTEKISKALEQPDNLRDELYRPVRAFLVNFQTYMEHLGSFKAMVALLPEGIWPAIDTTAYMLTDSFVQAHRLQHVQVPARVREIGIRELLAFALKTAWIQGKAISRSLIVTLGLLYVVG